MMQLYRPSDTNTDMVCSLGGTVIRQQMKVLPAYGDLGSDGYAIPGHQGAMGGPIDAPRPPVIQRYFDETGSDDWTCSSRWFASGREGWLVTAYSWDGTQKRFVTSAAADPEGLAASGLVMWDDALFWMTNTLHQSGVNVWTPSGGAKPLIRWIGDLTRGAGNFGTDGVDLVWTYGESKEPNEHVYPVRSVMTAPFTADPAALQPRRLRSELPPAAGLAGLPFQVGCGYAAHGGHAAETLVVRIADGWSWTIPILGHDFHLQKIIGVTCDEIFALGEFGGRWIIGRIRIDSLGPGSPPD